MYLLIILLPLISFFIVSSFGRKIGYTGSKIISCTLILICCLLSYFSFIEVIILKSNLSIYMWNWFDIGGLYNFIQFQFDEISCSMLILVLSVSFIVHLFSTSYMDGDPHLPRFMSYLSLFTFFMIILITSNNLIQLFVGWEGVGLCSYLLISFWFTRIQANKAAIKAMVMNKIGDLGLLLGIILIWNLIGSVDYNSIFSYCQLISNNDKILELISILLLIGVVGKSAQLGLHTWLPDAMEGPTPVSALIHAATMVTAGVFLIIRMSPVFDLSPFTLIIIVLLGSLTAFFTSTIGLAQNDLKKVIAYSTCSQLGYMVMICGFSYYNCGLFHLINHGFFKALLFLSAGSIIHSLGDEQDIRKMGFMNVSNPFTYSCIFIGSISLMGLPFLTGFYSKDLILELIYGEHKLSYSFWLGTLAASITAFYSFRLIYFVFINNPQMNINSYKNSHEGYWNLILPLFILFICSITVGYSLQFLILKDEVPVIIDNFNKFKPLILSLTGASLSILLGYHIFKWWRLGMKKFIINFYSILNGAWYFDFIVNFFIVKHIFNFGYYTTYKLIDNQILEYLGPTRLKNYLNNSSSNATKIHLGKISTYTFMFILFIVFFLFRF